MSASRVAEEGTVGGQNDLSCQCGSFCRERASPLFAGLGELGQHRLQARILRAGTGLENPFSVSSPIGSASTRSSTAVWTRRVTRICPARASSHSLDARFVTVPIAP